MHLFSRFLISLTFISCAIDQGNGYSPQTPAPEIDARILSIVQTTGELSSMVYRKFNNDTMNTDSTIDQNFEEIKAYNNEPDQAIMVKKEGRCFVSFRGTTATFADWEQNFVTDVVEIYTDNDPASGQFCKTRGGYAEFIDHIPELFTDIRACAKTCSNPEDCLVITGHSQGGAQALVAAVIFWQFKPTVITFGQPATLVEACPYVISENFYRFVNFKSTGFDCIPFLPNAFEEDVHVGYYLITGGDPNPGAMKYMGFNLDYDHDIPDRYKLKNMYAIAPNHSMASYNERINDLILEKSFGIGGFLNGSFCDDINDFCESGNCQSRYCQPNESKLCIPDSCKKDSDCVSGSCISNACALGPGQVAPGCPCNISSDCVSKECKFYWGGKACSQQNNLRAGQTLSY